MGIWSGMTKSLQIYGAASSPSLVIWSEVQTVIDFLLAVRIMGRFCGFILISSQQRISQAMGSVPAMSQPSGLGLPLIGPGPSIAITASISVRAGFKCL